MNTNERSVKIGELTLAVKTWGEASSPPILALHGWLDNAATFDNLVPFFPDCYWICPDLPGHGLSEHGGKATEYLIWDYCVEVMALADAMSLEKFTLLGHSMGGGIANLLCALFPARIEKLILLDAIGTITIPAADALNQMRMGLSQRIGQPKRKPGYFTTREEAIAARAKKGVDRDGAALLGARGISESAKGFYWHHDQRLRRRSLLSFSDEQIVPFLREIICPVLLITSKQAVLRKEIIKQRASLIRNIEIKHFPGGHHQHLDGDIETIAGPIKQFLDVV